MKIEILIFLVVMALLAAGCEVQIEQLNQTDVKRDAKKDADIIPFELTETECEKAGGKWNECGSPCAGTDAEFCIQVCQAQCECGGIAGFKCPKEYKCRLSGKKADETGVCVR